MAAVARGLMRQPLHDFVAGALDGADTDFRAPELLHLGKEYPLGYSYFRPRLHKAFAANAQLRDEDAIRAALARAQFVRKEIEAL